ncbi:hypothetical protein F5B21DRAFT_508451 [Xylaria acuta]|nr:hypothetical protein F5B21DRAFT_508451 [Xylaria acuta]
MLTRSTNIDLLPESRNSKDVLISATSNSPAVVLSTSGSTGTSEGVELSHYPLQNQMEDCISKWRFDDEVVLQQSSITVSKEQRGDALGITKIIDEEGVSVTCGVPSEYITWVQFGGPQLLEATRYKMMVSGSEPISTVLIRELRALGKRDLRTMNPYGSAEATISSNTIEVHYGIDLEVLQGSAPSGHTVPNHPIYILDENLDPVPVGVPERFVPDPFAPQDWKAKGWDQMHLSGDRGRLRASDGALLFEGRIKGDTQIKLRVLRIELQDIEASIVLTAQGVLASTVAPGEFLCCWLKNRSIPGYLNPHVAC